MMKKDKRDAVTMVVVFLIGYVLFFWAIQQPELVLVIAGWAGLIFVTSVSVIILVDTIGNWLWERKRQ